MGTGLRRLLFAACAGLAAATPARADRLELPKVAERTGVVAGTYVVDPPRAGAGTLTVEWTDSLGRLVARGTIAAEGMAVPFRLDATRAVAMQNHVRARLDRGGSASEARSDFTARPPARGWDDFRVIMYQDQEAPALAGLRAMGVSGMRVFGHRVAFTAADVRERVAPIAAANLQWYVENIATDFYSPYHMWTPEHPQQVHWRFLEAQARHRRDPADLSVYDRAPSLSDPTWQARIDERLGATVRAHGPWRPLYYSLGDEPGIADLAAAWDSDRSAPALAAFRAWLRVRYDSIDALNAAWGSDYAAWDAVLPEGTTAAMARTDDNYAAWNDHKAFMDASFGAALRAGTAAVHAADPAALAGIEGGQIPGWGGWDYSQVAPAVDVLEIYEAGQNIDIARSLNPALVTLTTISASGQEGRRQIWHAALKGAGGLILWDEDNGTMRPDGTPGPRGLSLGPAFARLTGGLGALLLAAPPVPSQVAMLYSPASFRLQWLLDHRAQGDAWTERSSELENQDNAVRAAMRGLSGALAGLGIVPRWITPEQLAAGLLRREGVRLLLLPQVLALSDGEAAAIASFAAAGGLVLAEGETGTFDGQLRRRPAPALPGVAAIQPGQREAALRAALATTGLRPPLDLPGSPAGPPTATIREFGSAWLVGIQAAAPGAAEFRVDPAPGGGIGEAARFVRDLLHDGAWQPIADARLALDADGTALLAFAPSPPGAIRLAVPAAPVRAGTTAIAWVRGDGNGSPGRPVRVELRDPAGRLAEAYSGNATLPAGPAGLRWPIPFAVNDPPGEWTLTMRDVLGGTVAQGRVMLAAE